MTPNRFDELSREFADGIPRRAVLKILAWSSVGSIFSPVPIFGQRGPRPQAKVCVTATVSACITAADAAFESESEGCQGVPNSPPEAIRKCLAAARRRRDAAVKACDPCPTGTRCESNVCCPNSQVTCAPPCNLTRTSDGSTLQSTVTSTVQGQNLVLTTTQTLPSRFTRSETGVTKFKRNAGPSLVATGTTAITLGQSQLVQIDYRSGNGAIQVKVVYGAAFQGINMAVFTGNGNLIQGNIDGRAVVPFSPATTDVSQIKFADGNPPPVVTIDPQILQATKDILAKGVSAASTCFKTQASRPKPFESPACIDCTDRCSDDYWSCAENVAGLCFAALFAHAACQVVLLIKCQTDYDSCVRDCDAPGKACCQVKCDQGGGCCDAGFICCFNNARGIVQCCGNGMRCASENTLNGICCPQESGPACHDHCCPVGQICADQTRGICCPAGSRLCGDTCCPSDQPCFSNGLCCNKGDHLCGGGCCPQGVQCINDFCCQPPASRLCGGVCCPGLLACCNNNTVCCGADELCIDDRQCCPRDRLCGHICCPTDRPRCQDPATQTCGTCEQGTVNCVSPTSSGALVSICCPPGVTCCLGKCCQRGEICAGPGGTCGTIH